MEVPWYKKVHKVAPWLLKCDGKIVKYDSRGFNIWRALFSFSHTILSDWDTWRHLNMLTVICFITMAICILTDSYRSIQSTSSVTARIQMLISFVFASYISVVISRWDRIRNTTLGALWGSLENLNMIAFRILKNHSTPLNDDASCGDADKRGSAPQNAKPALTKTQETELTDRVVRYSRLVMRLTFYATQGTDNLDPLVEAKVLTEKEQQWLEVAQIGTRPLIVVTWISEFFDSLAEGGYKVNEIAASIVAQNVTALRGGVGATLGAIGTQLPYGYVHLIYWTIQILLATLAVETGVVLASDVLYKQNGQGYYSPADDTVAWPQNPNVWYMNIFLQTTASNIIFALFCEGALKICDKLNNPMSDEDSSFSERVFDAFLHNNCQAMRTGFSVYTHLEHTPIAKPAAARSKQQVEKKSDREL